MPRTVIIRRFGAPGVMRVEDVPRPQPSASEILVHIRAAGVNPIETYMRAGRYERLPGLPYVPGSDGAGEVEQVGRDVTGVKPGDRVYIIHDYATPTGAGTYAEYACCGPSQVKPLPPHLSFSQGAAIGSPYGTAHRALHAVGRARSSETVLVHGATGGVGLAAVQLARMLGVTIIATGGSERGRQRLREEGVPVVLDHTDAMHGDQIMRATRGRGVDLVLEMAAHINLDMDLRIVARGGRIVVIGSRDRIEIDPRRAMIGEATILGMSLFNVTPEQLTSIHVELSGALANSSLVPVVARAFPLEDAPVSHQAVYEPGAVGRIVLLT